MTKVLYQHQKEGNLPVLNARTFIQLIESRDPKLQGFFNSLIEAMNLKTKNQQTQEILQQKIMILCYQMAGLRNKQVSGVKTAVGLFLVESGASTHCINTVANMGICSTYQTVFNKLENLKKNHESSVQTYVKNSVSYKY